MIFKRKTATFPAQNTNLLKKKLVCWAGNFTSALLIDRNNYPHFNSGHECIVGAGTGQSSNISNDAFHSLKILYENHHDWLFGYLSYDLKDEIEPSLSNVANARFDEFSLPSSYFFIPTHVVEIKNKQIIIHSTGDPQKIFNEIVAAEPGSDDCQTQAVIQYRFSKDEYIKTVEQLKEHILNGDIYEVNFCQEFFSENFIADPCSLFNKLNKINPSPFACFLKHKNNYALSASPERFLQKQADKISSQPMKGTIRRSNTVNEAETINKLRNDPKERAENVMIVDLVRNDLAKSAVPGSVKVDELFGIYSFPTVHQMISTISATIRKEVHFTDVIRNAFPAGSITGAPKVKAMQLIDLYERSKRGLFSGSMGFITPEADFDFNVVIRTLMYNTDKGFLSFQTGSAITADSVPEKEYEECLLKAEALINVLKTFEKTGSTDVMYHS